MHWVPWYFAVLIGTPTVCGILKSSTHYRMEVPGVMILHHQNWRCGPGFQFQEIDLPIGPQLTDAPAHWWFLLSSRQMRRLQERRQKGASIGERLTQFSQIFLVTPTDHGPCWYSDSGTTHRHLLNSAHVWGQRSILIENKKTWSVFSFISILPVLKETGPTRPPRFRLPYELRRKRMLGRSRDWKRLCQG